MTHRHGPDDEELAERLVAALWRDGAVVLLDAVGAECCDAVTADMRPYLAAAAERPTPVCHHETFSITIQPPCSSTKG